MAKSRKKHKIKETSPPKKIEPPQIKPDSKRSGWFVIFLAAAGIGICLYLYSLHVALLLGEIKSGPLCGGDGGLGWPEKAPFDAVIVTCAPDHVPQPLVDQLREGGRMIIPVGAQTEAQKLYILVKKDGVVEKKSVLPVRFVPMTGESEKK